MNIFSYIDKYGCYTFDEVEFNEVDNAILASLSYVSLYGIVSPNRYNKLTIREVADKYFTLHFEKEKLILAVKQSVKMLKVIRDTRRYGDLYLYNYIYEFSSEEQFSALTIELNKSLVYVSFEGTDQLVSGWKEDAMMAYTFPVESQRRAIDYVNKNFFFRRKEIILGGHSKGGNLAMIAGMYANFWVRDRIIKIYNNDGPGLLKEQFESKDYNNIKGKLIHIVPNYSIVGLLLYHSDNYKVVRASRRGIWSHDLYTWVVKGTNFVEASLDKFSKLLDDEMITWLKKHDREERERAILAVFDIFEELNIISVLDVMENKKLILDVISHSKKIKEEDRKVLNDFIKMILKCFKDVKIEQLTSLFANRNEKNN